MHVISLINVRCHMQDVNEDKQTTCYRHKLQKLRKGWILSNSKFNI